MDLLSTSLLYSLLLYNDDPIHNHIMLAKDKLCCCCTIKLNFCCCIIMHNPPQIQKHTVLDTNRDCLFAMGRERERPLYTNGWNKEQQIEREAEIKGKKRRRTEERDGKTERKGKGKRARKSSSPQS